MNLRRTSRRHKAGVNSEDYYEFGTGDRVYTTDGLFGRVTAVEDGHEAGAEQYQVELDHEMGGGIYTASQLRLSDDVEKTAAKKKMTFTHPGTGEVFTRTTDADYTYVSFKGRQIAWHWTEEAARRRSSDLYLIPGTGGSTDPFWRDELSNLPTNEKCHVCDGAGVLVMPRATGGEISVTCHLCKGKGTVLRAPDGQVVGTLKSASLWRVDLVEAGFGNLIGEFEAPSAANALEQAADAEGKSPPPGWERDFKDLNGDGESWELWLGWGEDDPRLSVTKISNVKKTALKLNWKEDGAGFSEAETDDGWVLVVSEDDEPTGHIFITIYNDAKDEMYEALGSTDGGVKPYNLEHAEKFLDAIRQGKADDFFYIGSTNKVQLEAADFAEDEDIYSLAIDDYPELAEILTEHPPMVHTEHVSSKSVKTASFNRENTIWQSADGTWSRGFLKTIWVGSEQEGFDPEWDVEYDSDQFEWVSTGWATEEQAAASWDGANPGGASHMEFSKETAEAAEELDEMARAVKKGRPGRTWSIWSSKKTSSQKTGAYVVLDGEGYIVAGPFTSRQDADEAEKMAREDGQMNIHIERTSSFNDHLGNIEALTKEGMGFFLDKFLYPFAEKMIEGQPEDIRFDPKTQRGPSYDWCRFRRSRHCYYPQGLDQKATDEAGYAVWVPFHRGYCAREGWEGEDGQKGCPVSEPGPNGTYPDRPLTDATYSWEEGGQRYDAAGNPVPPYPRGRFRGI